jgi:hypothetical protein
MRSQFGALIGGAIAIILFFVNMRSQFGAVIGGAIAMFCFFCEYAMKIN